MVGMKKRNHESCRETERGKERAPATGTKAYLHRCQSSVHHPVRLPGLLKLPLQVILSLHGLKVRFTVWRGRASRPAEIVARRELLLWHLASRTSLTSFMPEFGSPYIFIHSQSLYQKHTRTQGFHLGKRIPVSKNTTQINSTITHRVSTHAPYASVCSDHIDQQETRTSDPKRALIDTHPGIDCFLKSTFLLHTSPRTGHSWKLVEHSSIRTLRNQSYSDEILSSHNSAHSLYT